MRIAVSKSLPCGPLLVLLLAAPAAAASPAGPAEGPPGPYDKFFPFRLGDSWTFEWRITERGKPARTLARTRVVESTEFVGKGLAFRLVNDDGAYEAYSLSGGVLAIHSSAEGGRILSYDPPIVMAAPDMRPGEPRTSENRETGRRFRSTILGSEDVDTPLGRLQGCLKIRLEIEGPEFYSDQVHHFYPGVGQVAMRYELRSADRKTAILSVDSRLRLARLAGHALSKLDDVDALLRREAVSLPGKDDPSARAVLKRAAETRYTWDQKFPGFKGDFEYTETGKPVLHGDFSVDRDLGVHVDATTEAARATLRNQISSFISHRRFKSFDLEYAGAVFKKGETTPNGGVLVLAQGDTMGSRYVVRRNDILSVGRSVGRLRFVATNLSHIPTDDGRTIVAEYELAYFSNEDDTQVSSERSLDSYAKLGDYWLPTGRRVTRTEKGKEPSSSELKLLRLRYN